MGAQQPWTSRPAGGRWAVPRAEGLSPMGSVVMWPPPQGPGLSLRCLFRMAMRVTSTLRGAEGQGGQESPLPLLGQGPALRLMLPRGAQSARPSLFVVGHLPGCAGKLEHGGLSACLLAGSIPQRTAAGLPGPGPGYTGPPWLPGGPACPWPLPCLPLTWQCPRTQDSDCLLSPGATGRERAWRGAEPTGPASASEPPDCLLLV